MPRLARRAVLAALAAAAAVPATVSASTLAPPTALGTLSPSTAGSVAGAAPVVAGGTRFFVADDGDHGREPFAATGTDAPRLLKDLVPGTGSSDPVGFAVLGGVVYFAAIDADGAGLWTTDGTTAGTVRVADLTPDADDVPNQMVVSGGRLFIEDVSDGDGRLMVSDGTAAGTSIVGSYGAFSTLSALAGGVAFSSEAGGDGFEPWFSDGTPAGTVALGDLAPGPQGSFPSRMVSAGGLAFFAASGDDGQELYRTDGTPAGTFEVKDVNPSGTAWVTSLTAVGAKVFFAADDGVDGTELWSSDGTPAGTALVADLVSGAEGSDPDALTAFGGELYFAARHPATGIELYKSDGTEAGTVLVKDLATGTDDYGNVASGRPDALTVVGGTELYFSARSPSFEQSLWKSDGTGAGTVHVADVPRRGGTGITAMVDAGGGRVAFSEDDGEHGLEPWISDGTAAGTVMTDVNAAGTARPFAAGVAGGAVYVTGTLTGSSEHELAATDGTAAGTGRLGAATNVGAVTRVGGRTVFIGELPDASASVLWSTDGTAAGTRVITQAVTIDNGYLDTLLRSYVQELDGELYFRGTDDAHGTELWKTDGTAAGTALVKDIVPGADSSNVSALGSAGGKLVFRADDGAGHGDELWVSDGTAAGTTLLKDINDGSGSSAPTSTGWSVQTGRLGAEAYLLANDGSGRKQLWKTDATAAGTVRVKDLGVATGGLQQPGFTVAGGRIFFATVDGSGSDVRLWSSDGTTAGTRTIGPLRQGSSWQVTVMAALGGTLLYEPGDETGLWATRGDGTSSVRLTGAGVAVDDTTVMVANGRAYFAAREDAHGTELWSTDGTAAGTGLEADLRTGPLSSRPLPLGALGDTLIIALDRPGTGTVLESFAPPASAPSDPEPTDPVAPSDPAPPVVDPVPASPPVTPAAPPSGGDVPNAVPVPVVVDAPKVAEAPRTIVPARAGAVVKGHATLSLAIAVKADTRLPFRYAVSGGLRTSGAAACTGAVTVTLRRGDVALAKVVAKLGKDCKYRATLTKSDMKGLAHRSGTLTVEARFAGGATVKAARSPAVAVRYGR